MDPAAKPAEDSVKLFVGQVPRDWGADELRSVMMEAGHVYEVTIVRDRETKESKGCGFVLYMTREEADNAIKLFHCHRTLPGSKGPMQVKYADGQEVKIENKLFVGMLPKTVTAEELQAVFTPYGTVVDLNILRGPQHASRGSAFVKFATYAQALAAITTLNNKHKMAGQENTIVVKWADSDKEKVLRKQQKQQQQQQQHQQGMGRQAGGMGAAFTPSVAPPGPGAYLFPGPGAPPLYSSPLMQFGGFDPSMASAAAATMASGSYFPPPFMAHDAYGGALGHLPIPEAGANGSGTPDVVGVFGVPNTSASAVAAAVREKLIQREGPPGANIFVYNVPSEWRDGDLTTAFGEFGNVLSSKVYMDKLTGQSKNFGFVSYQAPEAAQAAIAVMDGFMVGGRKLKVSLKRGPAGTGAAAGVGGGVLQPQGAAGGVPIPLPGGPGDHIPLQY